MPNQNQLISHSTAKKIAVVTIAALYNLVATGACAGYSFNEIVPDVRQPANISGGSACPIPSHHSTSTAPISVRWSTALNTSPVTIITTAQDPAGQLNEIEQVISQSLATWTGVPATSLQPSRFSPLTRTAAPAACGSDGLNSICFDQADLAFTPGVLAFTRVVTADKIGMQLGPLVSTEVGQILDADIYFNPSDSTTTYATPSALPSAPKSYDLQSLLTHELGHFLGFSHSALWDAMMFPFAPALGTFNGIRSTPQKPDAALSDDDRTGLRVLYPDPFDTIFVGAITGRITPANPLSLPVSPPGVTGVFGSHVVAVDSASGSIIAATIGGWSCAAPGPVQFDGTYKLEHLPVNHTYAIYAEPLDGAVDPSQIIDTTSALCRNSTTDAGWPPLQSCTAPTADTSFTTRTRPAP